MSFHESTASAASGVHCDSHFQEERKAHAEKEKGVPELSPLFFTLLPSSRLVKGLWFQMVTQVLFNSNETSDVNREERRFLNLHTTRLHKSV